MGTPDIHLAALSPHPEPLGGDGQEGSAGVRARSSVCTQPGALSSSWRRRSDGTPLPGEDDRDDLRAARGVLASLLIGVGLWAILVCSVWLILR